jgi:hypothetical protein
MCPLKWKTSSEKRGAKGVKADTGEYFVRTGRIAYPLEVQRESGLVGQAKHTKKIQPKGGGEAAGTKVQGATEDEPYPSILLQLQGLEHSAYRVYHCGCADRRVKELGTEQK